MTQVNKSAIKWKTLSIYVQINKQQRGAVTHKICQVSINDQYQNSAFKNDRYHTIDSKRDLTLHTDNVKNNRNNEIGKMKRLSLPTLTDNQVFIICKLFINPHYGDDICDQVFKKNNRTC